MKFDLIIVDELRAPNIDQLFVLFNRNFCSA